MFTNKQNPRLEYVWLPEPSQFMVGCFSVQGLGVVSGVQNRLCKTLDQSMLPFERETRWDHLPFGQVLRKMQRPIKLFDKMFLPNLRFCIPGGDLQRFLAEPLGLRLRLELPRSDPSGHSTSKKLLARPCTCSLLVEVHSGKRVRVLGKRQAALKLRTWTSWHLHKAVLASC